MVIDRETFQSTKSIKVRRRGRTFTNTQRNCLYSALSLWGGY